MRERQPLVRRNQPAPDESAVKAMNAKLMERTRKIQNSRVEQRPARVAHNHEVVGSNPTPATIPSLAEQQEALRKLAGAPPLPDDPRDPAPPMKALTQRPVVPQGYVPEPPTLEWLKPVKSCQISSGGQYEVRAAKAGDAWVFIPYRGLDVLGGASKQAQEARDCCQAHFAKACSGVIRLEIPRVPCSPNDLLGFHWRYRKRNTDLWKREIFYALVQAGYTNPEPYERARVTIHRQSKRTLDPDNLVGAVKPVVDALRYAQVVLDDSPAHLELIVTQEGVYNSPPRLSIEVIPLVEIPA